MIYSLLKTTAQLQFCLQHRLKQEAKKLTQLLFILIEGETLETFLKRRNISDTFKYPAITFGFLDDEGYHEEEYVWRDSTTRKRINRQKRKNRIAWRRKLDEYIESIPDDTVIIGVDCHV